MDIGKLVISPLGVTGKASETAAGDTAEDAGGGNGPGGFRRGSPEADLMAVANYIRHLQDQSLGGGSATSDWGAAMTGAVTTFRQMVTDIARGEFPDEAAHQAFVAEVASVAQSLDRWADNAETSLRRVLDRLPPSQGEQVLRRTAGVIGEVRSGSAQIRSEIGAGPV